MQSQREDEFIQNVTFSNVISYVPKLFQSIANFSMEETLLKVGSYIMSMLEMMTV